MSIKYSILDLATIRKGDSMHETFNKSVIAAQEAEKLGFTRYWFSEHHNFENVASAATSILIGHIASQTTTLRVGSGGIMLPNHTTLSVAEQFGTLEGLFPGRIDLGLGRAPGTDSRTAQVLRRGEPLGNYDFEKHIKELYQFLDSENCYSSVRAIPGEGCEIPIYILGSSTDSAYLAAKLGLPYAFAAHFAPAQLEIAFEIYNNNFQPSIYLNEPYSMACINIIGADTTDEAHFLSQSHFQGFVNILTDQRQPLSPPEENQLDRLSDELRIHLHRMTEKTFIGSKSDLEEQLKTFTKRYNPNEIIVSGNIYNFEAKLKSNMIAAEIIQNI